MKLQAFVTSMLCYRRAMTCTGLQPAPWSLSSLAVRHVGVS